MIRVVLVDDHVVVRSGFAQLLSLEDDLDVAGQYSSAAEAWPALLRDDVNVAVLDIAMPDENGLSLLKRLRAQKPTFRAIVLSIYDTPAFVQSALDAGASGYLTKRCGPEELVQAVRSVGMGGHYLCADALRALRGGEQPAQVLEVLTPVSEKFLIYWSKATASKRSHLSSTSAIKPFTSTVLTYWVNCSATVPSSWCISPSTTSC